MEEEQISARKEVPKQETEKGRGFKSQCGQLTVLSNSP